MYNYIILLLTAKLQISQFNAAFLFFSNLFIGLWKPHSFNPWNPGSATNSLCDFGKVIYLL